ncbi:MAG: NAD-dependent epimerase/dehydratase family protein [Caldisphaera sp.]
MKIDKILLTGATGFIGKELVSKLLKQGYEIHTIERYVTGRYSLDQKDSVIKHYANLTDYNRVRTIVKEVQPNAVIHLAAISAVSFSYDNYIEVNEVNYLGSINLAEACRQEANNFKQFITAGTSEEYGLSILSTEEKLTEESPLIPNSPYAVAKVAFDYYLKYMGMAYDFPYTVIRPFNTYGRKDNKHFFIERTITQMLSQEKVSLGDPNTVRDWVYVDDHVNIYIKALGNDKAIKQTFNMCSGKGYTTKETAEIIAKLTNFKGEILWNQTPKRLLDAKVHIGDNSRAKELLGWESQYTLEDGLKRTVEYWKNKENVKEL